MYVFLLMGSYACIQRVTNEKSKSLKWIGSFNYFNLASVYVVGQWCTLMPDKQITRYEIKLFLF